MNSGEGQQLALPLPIGRMEYISAQFRLVPHQGWNVRVWHRHAGERDLCHFQEVRGGLSLAQAQKVVQTALRATQFPCKRDLAGCAPISPLAP